MYWQLPTYDGTKSYQNLLVEVYGVEGSRIFQNANTDTIAQHAPLHFIHSGFYDHSSSSIGAHKTTGYYWLPLSISGTVIHLLNLSYTNLLPQNTSYKGHGFSLRCLVSLVPRQLPTYDGTKSYQNLLVEVYGIQESNGNWQNANMDTTVQNAPLSLIRGGWYDFDNFNKTFGYYWKSNSYSTTLAGDLLFGPSYLSPQDVRDKGRGYPIRCLVR